MRWLREYVDIDLPIEERRKREAADESMRESTPAPAAPAPPSAGAPASGLATPTETR